MNFLPSCMAIKHRQSTHMRPKIKTSIPRLSSNYVEQKDLFAIPYTHYTHLMATITIIIVDSTYSDSNSPWTNQTKPNQQQSRDTQFSRVIHRTEIGTKVSSSSSGSQQQQTPSKQRPTAISSAFRVDWQSGQSNTTVQFVHGSV